MRTIVSLLAVIAAVTVSIFLKLDRRNQELVHIAEDILYALEEDVLFEAYERPRESKDPVVVERLGIQRLGRERSCYEHSKWMPRLQPARQRPQNRIMANSGFGRAGLPTRRQGP